ncbi:hypothetical protein BH23GEM3_BH23GEM3_11410 [soil metagenome]|nr:hypothetical protein [Gemmatimonadota bacterium]
MGVIEMWWLSLAVAAVVVVVVAVLLGLIIAAAKSIDVHAAEIWTAGKQIAGNTVAIWMLEKTNESLGEITVCARSIEQTAGSMNETLRAVAEARG